jgi:hypothetical protein
MPLSQSKTKMDSGGFDIWHHGGDNRKKISYKIPYIKQNISQRPTSEGSVSDYMYPRIIYSTYLLIYMTPPPLCNQCGESIRWRLLKRLGHEMDWSFVDMQR